MMNNQAALSNARTAASNAHANQPSASKAFYYHVRLNFLQQSASYLRDSISRGKTVSAIYHNKLIHP